MRINYFDEHLPRRVTLALFFGLCFAVIGWLVPETYFKYMDKTQYYTVVQPIPINQKWFKPCDDTILTATRTSLVDTQAVFGVDLILKDKNGTGILKVPNAHFITQASVRAGERVTVSVVYKLPCKLPDGLYYWQATMRYHVRGVEKEYTYVSDTFNVNQYGFDPEVVKIATRSGQLAPKPAVLSIRESKPIIAPSATVTQTPPPSQTNVYNNTFPPASPPESSPTPEPEKSLPQKILDTVKNLF